MNNSIAAIRIKSLLNELIELGKIAEHLLKNTELDIHRVRNFRDIDNYETELKQVAAVAVAALTDIKMQRNPRIKKEDVEFEIIDLIMAERDRQDTQFKRDAYPIPQDPALWILVLLAELREVAEEVVEKDIC